MGFDLDKYGVSIPEIMLPAKGVDLEKWSVVACDQFTSERDYWEKVKELVENSPSTLNLIFPEIYLKDPDHTERINNINRKMQEYLDEGILEPQKPGFILVDRKTSHSASRKGLIIAVDLEKYDYNAGSESMIRATEGTVLDRIPPRVKIRENAPVELPHIMILVDDPDRTLIEPLFEKISRLEKVYDFDLMLGGGHIKGYRVDDDESISGIAAALKKLSDNESFKVKYGLTSDKGILLFAVGDGNHSLASAKAHWENVKAEINRSAGSAAEDLLRIHPARYALAELINVHDEGIVFEPIHRVLFNVKADDLLKSFVDFFNYAEINCEEAVNEASAAKEAGIGQSGIAAGGSAAIKAGMSEPASRGGMNVAGGIRKADYKLFDSKADMLAALSNYRKDDKLHAIPFISGKKTGILLVYDPACNLEVGTLQTFLDYYIRKNPDVEIDYIHGSQALEKLGSAEGCMGFYLPVMSKHDLFKTVILEGVLPRKTFSMGEAEEKRYYLECRKIR